MRGLMGHVDYPVLPHGSELSVILPRLRLNESIMVMEWRVGEFRIRRTTGESLACSTRASHYVQMVFIIPIGEVALYQQ